jgi:hypothetical protein
VHPPVVCIRDDELRSRYRFLYPLFLSLLVVGGSTTLSTLWSLKWTTSLFADAVKSSFELSPKLSLQGLLQKGRAENLSQRDRLSGRYCIIKSYAQVFEQEVFWRVLYLVANFQVGFANCRKGIVCLEDTVLSSLMLKFSNKKFFGGSCILSPIFKSFLLILARFAF